MQNAHGPPLLYVQGNNDAPYNKHVTRDPTIAGWKYLSHTSILYFVRGRKEGNEDTTKQLDKLCVRQISLRYPRPSSVCMRTPTFNTVCILSPIQTDAKTQNRVNFGGKAFVYVYVVYLLYYCCCFARS